MALENLLRVRDLKTSFFTYAGEVRAVDGVSFEVAVGEAVAIVGESGCGKSVTAMSLLRLIPEPGKVLAGSVELGGRDLLRLKEREMRHVRGNDISMVFQDPMTSLNPVLTIGTQLAEAIRQHQKVEKDKARARAIETLEMVKIPSPDKRLAQYPHQLSGGMRQRVMMAMALSCHPRLVIADEPTTSLDVTIQAQIIELLKEIKKATGMSIILITHNLGVVAGLATRVIVMYAGKIVEYGPVKEIYQIPQHPYTWGLLKSVPRLDAAEKRRLVPIYGQPPDLLKPPAGCRFHPRCDHAMKVCREKEAPFVPVNGNGEHRVACWLQHPAALAVAGFKKGVPA
ncbi:MAG: ABC transporter ATP-binding protein [Bacillota bacterium]